MGISISIRIRSRGSSLISLSLAIVASIIVRTVSTVVS